MATNYYKKQLEGINPKATIHAPTIKIFANGNGQDTKNLDLNKESAQELINWLTKHFICEGKKALHPQTIDVIIDTLQQDDSGDFVVNDELIECIEKATNDFNK